MYSDSNDTQSVYGLASRLLQQADAMDFSPKFGAGIMNESCLEIISHVQKMYMPDVMSYRTPSGIYINSHVQDVYARCHVLSYAMCLTTQLQSQTCPPLCSETELQAPALAFAGG